MPKSTNKGRNRAIILNLRGTHGSGKTYIVRSLMERYKWQSYNGVGKIHRDGPSAERHLGHYFPSLNTTIVGKYTPGNTSGGCDQIADPTEVCRRVALFASLHKYVLFEGVVVAHTYERYHELSNALEGEGHVFLFCFLDTPLDTCLERVRKRNEESKSPMKKPFNPTSTIKDYKNIWETVQRKCRRDKHKVVILKHETALQEVEAILKGKKPVIDNRGSTVSRFFE